MEVRREWPIIRRYLTPPKIERFWQLVDKRGPDDCWEWQGPRNAKSGYGFMSVLPAGYGPISAHRIAYGLTNGAIPRLKHVLHSCDNPPCCNPAHLSAGTHQDNMKDMLAKSRAGWQTYNDCACGRSKLRISKRCRDCQTVFQREQGRKKYHATIGEERRLAFGEALWAIAVRFPLTRADLVARLDGDTRRAQVCLWFFGLYGMPRLTMEEIGSRLGITRERTRQLRDAAMLKLDLDDCLIPLHHLGSGVRNAEAENIDRTAQAQIA